MAEALANPKEVTDELVEAWVAVLSLVDFPPSEMGKVTARVMVEQTFFPAPATFLKAWKPPDDLDARDERAWQTALGCVRRLGRYASLCLADVHRDRAVLWALERIGWERLCRELDESNLSIRRAEFVRIYRLAHTDSESLDYLPGEMERLNDAAGHDLTPALVGRPDWPELPRRTATPALPAGTPDLATVFQAMPVETAADETQAPVNREERRAAAQEAAAQVRQRLQAPGCRFGDLRARALWQQLQAAQDGLTLGVLEDVTAVRLEGEALVCRVRGMASYQWLTKRQARLVEGAREDGREFPELRFRLDRAAEEQPEEQAARQEVAA